MPGGIREPVTGKSFLFFGTHYKTSGCPLECMQALSRGIGAARRKLVAQVLRIVAVAGSEQPQQPDVDGHIALQCR